MPRNDGTGSRGLGQGGGRGRNRGNRPGVGPIGHCACPRCGAKVPHQIGVPCYSVTCDKCGATMIRI